MRLYLGDDRKSATGTMTAAHATVTTYFKDSKWRA